MSAEKPPFLKFDLAKLLREGDKTNIANQLGVKKTIGHYERISTDTNFVEKSHGLMSIGLAVGREVILIDEADVKEIIAKWDNYYRRKGQISDSQQDVLPLVNQFTRELFPAPKTKDELKHIEERLENIVLDFAKDLGNIMQIKGKGLPKVSKFPTVSDNFRVGIPLSAFINRKLGVCRHADLVNCIVMAHLVNQDPAFRNSKAGAEVRQFRANIKKNGKIVGANAVATYISEGRIWVLDKNFEDPIYLIDVDATPKTISEDDLAQDPRNFNNVLKFIKLVGPEFYQEMFARLLFSQELLDALNLNAAAAKPEKPQKSVGNNKVNADKTHSAPKSAGGSAGSAAAVQKPEQNVVKHVKHPVVIEAAAPGGPAVAKDAAFSNQKQNNAPAQPNPNAAQAVKAAIPAQAAAGNPQVPNAAMPAPKAAVDLKANHDVNFAREVELKKARALEREYAYEVEVKQRGDMWVGFDAEDLDVANRVQYLVNDRDPQPWAVGAAAGRPDTPDPRDLAAAAGRCDTPEPRDIWAAAAGRPYTPEPWAAGAAAGRPDTPNPRDIWAAADGRPGTPPAVLWDRYRDRVYVDVADRPQSPLTPPADARVFAYLDPRGSASDDDLSPRILGGYENYVKYVKPMAPFSSSASGKKDWKDTKKK